MTKDDLPKYVHRDPDRHGNPRLYYIRLIPGTKKLFKFRLRADPGSRAFSIEYKTAFDHWNRLYKPGLRKRINYKTPGKIYFLRSGDRIKIGFTTGDLPVRVNALQTGSAEVLEVLGAYDGIQANEKDAHEIFAQQRVNREWFAITPDLLEYIERKVGKSNFSAVGIAYNSVEHSFSSPVD